MVYAKYLDLYLLSHMTEALLSFNKCVFIKYFYLQILHILSRYNLKLKYFLLNISFH